MAPCRHDCLRWIVIHIYRYLYSHIFMFLFHRFNYIQTTLVLYTVFFLVQDATFYYKNKSANVGASYTWGLLYFLLHKMQFSLLQTSDWCKQQWEYLSKDIWQMKLKWENHFSLSLLCPINVIGPPYTLKKGWDRLFYSVPIHKSYGETSSSIQWSSGW